MNYVISILAAIAESILGNWLALLFYFPLLVMLGKVFPQSKGPKLGILTLYISRACMGVGVSLVFWAFEYLGALRSVLTLTFGIWALFFSEPFSEVEAHDLCQGNVKKYKSLRWKLKIIRIAFYFSTNFLVLALIYLIAR